MKTNPRFFPKPRHWTPLPGFVDTSELQNLGDLRRLAIQEDFRNSESYRWQLSEARKTLSIGGEAALRYAFAHLRQWQGEDAARTRCGILEDAPTFARRGFMLDVSRCKVPTREGLSRWVERLAAFRFNELQLYTEHTFAYTGHETVWQNASPMTPEDVRWLQTLCRDSGIELVPNQNTFGHFERWLRHPEYRPLAEAPDGFRTPWGEWRNEGSVLQPTDASFALVTGLLDQLLPLFDSPWVNIGCDETWELGQGASRERCEREGTGAVYADFVRRIMEYVIERHGKQPQFWGDILKKFPEQLAKLPVSALALEWGYEADHPFARDCRLFGDSGLAFAVCPGTSSWNSFAGRTENMLVNIRSAVMHGTQAGARGFLLTDWGDNGHLQQDAVSWPALAWAAVNAWNPETATLEDALAWCDAAAFGGDTGASVRWMDLGRVSERLGWQPGNRNALFALFQGLPQDEKRDGIPGALLEDTLRHLDTLPAPQAEAEAWRQTARNLRLALCREMCRRTGCASPEALETEAREAHATLWRRWNREGGLAESLSFYTRTAVKS